MPIEAHLKILKHIQTNPNISQRQLAQEIGVSVGKVNYCLRALIDKGFVEAYNFKSACDKASFLAFINA
jgi:DNA-binding Lrp family transcriptional regulator